MAKVKIQGNASGTGVVTLTAPNTNADRTITLPDEDITLGGGVDGIVSTANATAITIDSSENVTLTKSRNDTSANLTLLNSQSSGYGTAIDFNTGYDGGYTFGRIDTENNSTGGMLRFFTSDTSHVVTERLRLTHDGRGLSQFTAKAWVNFNATGTLAIRDSHNVSSVSDNAVGTYTVNLSNALANTNYTVSGNSIDSFDTGAQAFDVMAHYPKTTGSYYALARRIDNDGHTFGTVDPTRMQSIVFGD